MPPSSTSVLPGNSVKPAGGNKPVAGIPEDKKAGEKNGHHEPSRANGDGYRDQPRAYPSAVAVPAKTRVYLVDDHPLMRAGLAALIDVENDMAVCGQAEDATTGLQEIMKLHPNVVIVDITLKGNSGLELIKSIRAFSPKIQVMVLSMHDEAIYALRSLKAGARAYVMKHEASAKVVKAIRRTAGGDLFVSDYVADEMLNQLSMPSALSEPSSPVASLSDRELEVVASIGQGLLTREIAARLHVSVKTIETHRAHIKQKVHVKNAVQLVQFCVRWVEENSQRRDPLATTFRASPEPGGVKTNGAHHPEVAASVVGYR